MPRHRLPATLGMLVAVLCAGACAATRADARSLVDATPNMPMSVQTAPGQVEFVFAHRFDMAGGEAANEFEASPTLSLTGGLAPGWEAVLNFSPSTSINAAANGGMLLEPMVDDQFLAAGPLHGLAYLAYNSAAISGDGAVMLTYDLGPLGMRAIAKGFTSTMGAAGPGAAAGLGGVYHFNQNWSVVADWNQLVWSRNPGAIPDGFSTQGAWSGGLNFAIPYSPHSLMLYVTNANTGTLQETSVGSPFVRYGFAFLMPFGSADRYKSIFFPTDD